MFEILFPIPAEPNLNACGLFSGTPAHHAAAAEAAFKLLQASGTDSAHASSTSDTNTDTTTPTSAGVRTQQQQQQRKVKFLSSRSPSKYLRLQQLGEGGCGVVWRVERTEDRCLFAAKVVLLRPQPAISECGDQGLRDHDDVAIRHQYALNEPKFASMCDSPFIIRYVDHWTDHKRAVVTVMELCDGVNLGAHIRTIATKAAFHLKQFRRMARGLPTGGTSELASSTVGADDAATPYSPSGHPGALFEVSQRKLLLLAKNPALQQHYRAAQHTAMTETEAAVVFAQIILGVHHMHGRGILHRDMKPGNVFIGASGLIKIGDFGLSAFTSRASPLTPPEAVATMTEDPPAEPKSGRRFRSRPFLADVAVGTPSYMAPELWCTRDMPPYSEKSDIWAVGVMLYEMLAGRMAFPSGGGDDCSDVGAGILSGVLPDVPPQLIRTINPALLTLVRSLTHPDPSQRPTAQEALRSPVMRSTCDMLHDVVSGDASLAALQASLLAEIRPFITTVPKP